VLELEPPNGEKTGENFAIAFERILRQLAIWPPIGHITTDGGSDFLAMFAGFEPLLPGFSFDNNNGLRYLAGHILIARVLV
jgi:hypothetical protein